MGTKRLPRRVISWFRWKMFNIGNKEYINAAASRSCQPILEVLLQKLRPVELSDPAGRQLAAGREGVVLEISSGAGLHIIHFAPHFPQLTFLPSEFDAEYLKIMRENIEKSGLPNINPPIFLDASKPSSWAEGKLPAASLSAIININMVHVSPFECAKGLFKGAGEFLAPSGCLFTYGAYAFNGVIRPESNVAFDKAIRDRDSSFGLRDVHRELEPLAEEAGLTLKEIHNLPANNHLLVWEKSDRPTKE